MKKLNRIPNTFTTTIALREFVLYKNNNSLKLIVEIGKPIADVELADGNFDWRCPLKISYKNKVFHEYACGSDSLQALELTITQLLKMELKKITKEENAKIMYLDVVYDIDKGFAF